MTTRKFSFIKKYKEDFLSLIILLIVSIPVRVINLGKIPFGLHGDEAWTGIDARTILNNGSIAAYSGNALGQPTGPMYLTALMFKLFGDSIFSLRLSMAIFGILTVAAFYVLSRLLVKKEAAFLSTIALAFSLYHIHFSRIAFMLIAAPLFQIAGLIFLVLGRRKNNLWLMGLSGIVVGLGMYSYNAYILFPLTVFLLLAYDLIAGKFSKKELVKSGVFLLTFILVSLPLLKIMVTQSDFYFAHHKSFFIFNTARVKAIDNNADKLKFVFDEGIKNIRGFFFGNKVDGADGFGKYHTFGVTTLIFFFIGILASFLKKNKKYLFFVFSLLLFLSACFLTIDGVYRRQIVSLPYIFLLAALGVDAVLEKIKSHRLRDFAFAILFVFVILDSSRNVYTYFQKFPQDQETDYVFGRELMQKINNYKNGYYERNILNLKDTNWKCDYETVKYLLNKVNCLD